MNAKPVLSLLFCLLPIAACASSATTDSSSGDVTQANAPDQAQRATAPESEPDPNAGFTQCSTDSDCTAVPSAPGCCNNGWKQAIARALVKEWQIAKACHPVRPVMCPMYIVRDDRVAMCNPSSHRCEMAPPGGQAAAPRLDPFGQEPCDGGVTDPPDADAGPWCPDNVLCIRGYHWSTSACTCVPNPNP
jgi:hypothetical protein